MGGETGIPRRRNEFLKNVPKGGFGRIPKGDSGSEPDPKHRGGNEKYFRHEKKKREGLITGPRDCQVMSKSRGTGTRLSQSASPKERLHPFVEDGLVEAKGGKRVAL